MLIDCLDLINWSIPKIIISNLNLKFLLELWRVIHKILDVKLFDSIAYHLQTNESSKYTNQTTEIAVQFYLHTINWPENWLKMLLHIQFLINNAKSSITIKTSNKIALGFTPNQSLDLLADSIRLNHKVAQIEAKNAIWFAQVNYKHHYNCFHQSINLKINNFAFLCFYKRYSISMTLDITKKLRQ